MAVLYELARAAAAARPLAVAVESEEVQYTYGDLLDAIDSRRRSLEQQGMKTGDRVAVEALAGITMVLTVLALDSLGAVVVPVADWHTESMRCQVLGCTWVIRPDDAAERATPGRARCDQLDLTEESTARIPVDTVYVLATSGSTSAPKDVPIGDRQLRALSVHCAITSRVHPSDRLALVYEPTFDPYYGVLLFWLTGGAALIIPRPRAALLLSRFVSEHRISFLDCVPSLLEIAETFRSLNPQSMPDLRVAQVGGEPFPPRLARVLRDAAPNASIFNVYGPTEATVTATEFLLPAKQWQSGLYDSAIPIGTPVYGMQATVFEADKGGVGELALTGPQIFDGYSQEEYNLRAFTDVPFRLPRTDGRDAVNHRWYLTGDLVRASADGYVFQSRKSSEQKVMGRRVDLALVDAEVLAAVGASRVVTRIVDGRIVSLASLPRIEGEGVQVLTIGRFEGLRAYAQPSLVIACREIPMFANGKVDEGRVRAMFRQVQSW